MTQFVEISADAQTSSSQVRRSMRARSLIRRAASSSTAITTDVQTIRCARTSTAPAGLSSGKKAGKTPQEA